MQPRKKKYSDFWSEFEDVTSSNGLVSTIPSCIKSILTAVGYNSALSIIQIDEQRIKEIEEFVETNCRGIIDSIDVYKYIKPFTFLPGHKALILGIKSEIQNLQDAKKPKVTTFCKPQLSESDLKVSLVNQLSAFTSKNGLDIDDWSKSVYNITLTSSEHSTHALCSIKCPVCAAKSTIRYDSYWKVSNICKHLRKHFHTVPGTETAHKVGSTSLQVSQAKTQTMYGDIIEEEFYVDVSCSVDEYNEDYQEPEQEECIY